ncbi:hypothetical protein PsYK624_125870 [Phanerochaete sordida]|uniref:Uncharacterized protein n=1 Tax=Phanerochaete sordida TaxID=48140 RepID=A0A9P3GKE1_9APHY|nr:hypothetical protein PsYK624_125870 [Phanerochaete sordida]
MGRAGDLPHPMPPSLTLPSRRLRFPARCTIVGSRKRDVPSLNALSPSSPLQPAQPPPPTLFGGDGYERDEEAVLFVVTHTLNHRLRELRALPPNASPQARRVRERFLQELVALEINVARLPLPPPPPPPPSPPPPSPSPPPPQRHQIAPQRTRDGGGLRLRVRARSENALEHLDGHACVEPHDAVELLLEPPSECHAMLEHEGLARLCRGYKSVPVDQGQALLRALLMCRLFAYCGIV